MLSPTSNVQIFLARGSVDMRFGYDRLAEIVRNHLEKEPYGGQMFVFFNRRRTRARIFYYDGSGTCLFSKRLEIGRFQIPPLDRDGKSVSLAASDLSLLLEGADVGRVERPAAWQPSGATAV